MLRFLLFTTTFLGIALAVSFFAAQGHTTPERQSDERITAVNPFLKANQTNADVLNATGVGTTIFSVSDIKHYLCALEVKKRNEKEIQIQESATACTKTIPEYLAEPGCK